MQAYEESDEYCPHCDNHYVRAADCLDRPTFAADGRVLFVQVIDAKTPNAMLTVESEDTRVDNRCVPLFHLHQAATSCVLFSATKCP